MSVIPLQQVKPEISLSEFVTENIRAEMARRRVTQKDLSIMLGIAQSRISARMSGKSTWQLDELIPVADALGVGISTLIFGYENTPAPYDVGVLSSPNWTRTSNPSISTNSLEDYYLPLAA